MIKTRRLKMQTFAMKDAISFLIWGLLVHRTFQVTIY
uniref:Uncharacterized protein n=1 Tax=Arundo donax TaxID=35708 RepID=A0A0A9AME6_ARUDO